MLLEFKHVRTWPRVENRNKCLWGVGWQKRVMGGESMDQKLANGEKVDSTNYRLTTSSIWPKYWSSGYPRGLNTMIQHNDSINFLPLFPIQQTLMGLCGVCGHVLLNWLCYCTSPAVLEYKFGIEIQSCLKYDTSLIQPWFSLLVDINFITPLVWIRSCQISWHWRKLTFWLELSSALFTL